MLKLIKKLFTKTPKETVQDRIDATNKIMVGEPVISFVRCLQATPKRFKLKVHTYSQVVESGEWPEIYPWMRDKLDIHTGYVSLTDKKDDSKYYAIIHKGRLYSVKGLNFPLNGWESEYICKSFHEYRLDAMKRKQRIDQSHWERVREADDIIEKQERLKLMEKFV